MSFRAPVSLTRCRPTRFAATPVREHTTFQLLLDPYDRTSRPHVESSYRALTAQSKWTSSKFSSVVSISTAAYPFAEDSKALSAEHGDTTQTGGNRFQDIQLSDTEHAIHKTKGVEEPVHQSVNKKWYKESKSLQKNVQRSPRQKVFSFATEYRKLVKIHLQSPGQEIKAFADECRFADRYIRRVSPDQLRNELKQLVSQDFQTVQKLLIGSLATSVQQTLLILSNLEPIPGDFIVRMKCLLYIHSHYPDQLTSDADLKKIFELEIAKQRHPNQWPTKDTSDRLFDLLLRESSPPQCDMIIHSLLLRPNLAQPQTLRKIIAHYLRTHQPGKAFDLLQTLPDKLLENPGDDLMPLCAQLIKHDVVVETETGPNFKYLSKLLEIGFRPDPLLYTRIISNALNAGFGNVAWDIYRHLTAEGVETKPPVYLMLLRHAFLTEDVKSVNEIMSAILEREDLYSYPTIIAYTMNMVRIICCHQTRTTPYEALSHILAIYDRAYNREPLVKLGIVSTDRILPSSKQSLPPTEIISFTIWSYILIQRHPHSVRTLWNWIKQLARKGDSSMLEVLRQDVVYNGIILFYARWDHTLLQGLEVVEYMLEANYCQPTSRTWSLLICAFLRHRKIDKAQKILKLMHSHGHEITSISERHLPNGYTLEDLDAGKDEILDETRSPSEVGFSAKKDSIAFKRIEVSNGKADVWEDFMGTKAKSLSGRPMATPTKHLISS